MHASEKHGAKDDPFASTRTSYHLAKSQMADACQAYAQATRVEAQRVVERRGQHDVAFTDVRAVSMHFAQAERCRRLDNIAEELTEEAIMLFLADAESSLCDEVSEGLWRSQG